MIFWMYCCFSGGDGNFVLSTSFVGFTSVHGGVTPMCKDGYGFFYRMGDNRYAICILPTRIYKDSHKLRVVIYLSC